jgi:hypothetical protein
VMFAYIDRHDGIIMLAVSHRVILGNFSDFFPFFSFFLL